jgi:hypothetical protein
MEVSPINAPDVSEIERGIAAFARFPNGGLIVTVGGTAFHRNEIIARTMSLLTQAARMSAFGESEHRSRIVNVR